MHQPLRRSLSAWVPPLVYMIGIFFVSGQSSLPSVVRTLLNLLTDKALHAAAYAGLTVLYIRGARLQFERACALRIAVFSVLAATIYGLSDEWHQIYVPHRTADLHDVLADAIGACLAAAFYLFWYKRRYGSIRSCRTE